MDGVITGSTAFTKSGAGTLVLTATNTLQVTSLYQQEH